MAQKSMIIIHCTATAEGKYYSVETIRGWHLARGFTDIGYNYVILLDGTLSNGRPLSIGGAHTSGYNSCSIGIAYVGGCAIDGKTPKDTRTQTQEQTLYTFVRSTLMDYKNKGIELTVHGHYEFAAKACPSFNVEQWLIDRGLVTEFPWLANSPNMLQYKSGQRVKRKGTEGIGCSVTTSNIAINEDKATREAAYVSPHKAERDEIEKDVPVHKNNIYSYQNNQLIERSLFGDKFYYLQNGYSQLESDKEKLEVQKCVKALIYLHTLPFDYNTILHKGFFNNSAAKHGGVELVPEGYLALLGGLIWRKKWYDKNSKDPVEYGYYDNSTYVQLYEKPEYGYDPLFHKDSKGIYKCAYARTNSGGQDVYNVGYEEFINVSMDDYTANMLISEFMYFVHSSNPYINELELKYKLIENNTPTNNSNGQVTYATESSNGNIHRMTYYKMNIILQYMLQSPIKDNLYATLEYLTGRKHIVINESQSISITGFANNYAMGFIDNGSLSLYYTDNKDATTAGNIIYNVAYSFPILAATTGRNDKFVISDGSVYEANYKSYLNGFCDTIEYYVRHDPDIKKNINRVEVEQRDDEKDFKCEIYALLKNLWDRWLCGFYNSKNVTDNNYFTVGQFFNNFAFFDTFYNNISSLLRLNCRLLQTRYEGNESSDSNSGGSVVQHLGGVASDHQCAMFNFPDFANFCSEDENAMYNNLKEMFVPIPQNKVGLPSVMNRFVIIYTHSAKSLSTIDRNKFIPDTFDIWSYDEGTKVAPSVYNKKLPGAGLTPHDRFRNDSRMAYKVPAFGVAYSRQDNSYWKNIKVGMDTQTVTEQAARALSQIAEMGSSSKKKIVFYGQDIYSIYQAYSYVVTIEMMGNAQIQPLMYFQLMNIPMFRGTYMIIKVEHNIKVGDMTTTFTGMKMSKVQKPFTTSWFAVTGPDSDGITSLPTDADTALNGDLIRTTDGNALDIADNKLSDVVNKYIGQQMLCDEFVRRVYKEGFNIDIKHNLAYENNENMFTELNSDGKWDVKLFKKRPRKTNNWEPMSSSSTHPQVGEILFGYHNGVIDGKHMHVGIYLGMHDGHHYIAEGGDNDIDKSTTGISNNTVQVAMIESSMMCNSTDIYTHHALCTSANIEQVKREEEKKKTEQSTRNINSTTPGSNDTDGLFVVNVSNTLHILDKKHTSNASFPDPDTDTGITYCAQAAFTAKGGGLDGIYVTNGKAGCGNQFVTYGGGFIYYKDGSYKFCRKFDNYYNLVKDDIGGTDIMTGVYGYNSYSIECAFQNYLIIHEGNKCPNCMAAGRKNEKFHFRTIAELNGHLVMVVCDIPITFSEFQDKLLSIGVTNAIYHDSWGHWEYGWCRTDKLSINGNSNKIKNGVYYWRTGKKENNSSWSNILYF